MRQVRRRYAPLRLLRLLTLATNCRLAQDTVMYFTAIAPALPSDILVAVLPLSLEAYLDGVFHCVAIAFAASPVACSRGGPPPGFRVSSFTLA